jgi:SAM-dependent methyltransferase
MEAEAYRLMEELDNSHWWYRARREIICAAVARLVRPGAAILDYGCGTGSIGLLLQERGYRVVGAEVAPQALGVCRARGLTALDLARESPSTGAADCVLSCDVLEHVEDDVGLLARLRATIRPGGCFLGTVPAYECLWSGEDYVSGHVRRYTRSDFRQRLRQAGYRVSWCGYFLTLLFPLAAGVILGKRLFCPGAMRRSNLKQLPGWLNRVLYRVFALEGRLLRYWNFPFGLSIIAAARPVDHCSAAA